MSLYESLSCAQLNKPNEPNELNKLCSTAYCLPYLYESLSCAQLNKPNELNELNKLRPFGFWHLDFIWRLGFGLCTSRLLSTAYWLPVVVCHLDSGIWICVTKP